ncbi:hypothetical protein SPHINGO8AM_130008 [Sphingomonas sp. 8AM]|nr:hypothetical protein SPHINGO8AM_130008 [Sphingomonas sp. 8AM]
MDAALHEDDRLAAASLAGADIDHLATLSRAAKGVHGDERRCGVEMIQPCSDLCIARRRLEPCRLGRRDPGITSFDDQSLTLAGPRQRRRQRRRSLRDKRAGGSQQEEAEKTSYVRAQRASNSITLESSVRPIRCARRCRTSEFERQILSCHCIAAELPYDTLQHTATHAAHLRAAFRSSNVLQVPSLTTAYVCLCLYARA